MITGGGGNKYQVPQSRIHQCSVTGEIQCEETELYHNHPFLERQPQSECAVEALVSKLKALDGVIVFRITCAGNVVHIQSKRVSQSVREERRADSGCKNGFLRVPRP